MSRIDDLIAKYCPEGVEWKRLDEICITISAGGDLPPKFEKGQRQPSIAYPYPIYSNGSGESALYGYTNEFRFDTEAVTVSARGTIGYHCVRNGRFTTIVRLITLVPDGEVVLPKYLNYALDITPISHSGGSIPQLTVPNVSKISIPIPPLPIQHAIVEVLDAFSKLEAELEAELEARRRQYSYYRDTLLAFDSNSFEIQLQTLDDICHVNRGRVMSKDYLRDHAGPYPVYSSQTLNDGVFGSIDSFDYDYESITWTTDGANAGSVFYHINEKFSITNVCGVLKVRNNSQVSTRYLYYALSRLTKRHVSEGMGNPKLMSNVIGRIKVLMPPLTEQKRVVGILDKFDALVNDLTIGLPAEIAARRNQYEHYRDRLFTFKEKVA